MSEGKPVCGYYRVSQARDDMAAPAIYEEQIRSYCTYKKLDLGGIFNDIDFSGWRGSPPRPGLEDLIRRRREFSGVIFPKLSRAGRSLAHLTKLFELFAKDEIPLIFLDLNLDTSTSQGRLLRNVLACFAEFESDVKSDYAKAAHAHMAKQGRATGGGNTVPYGYVYNPQTKSVDVDRDRAPIVREVFERYLKGESINAITRDFNRRGLRPTRKDFWYHDAVSRMLRQPMYAGYRRWDGKLVAGAWEPIVSKRLWTAVAAEAERRYQPRSWRTSSEPHLLTGLVFCGTCGKKIYYNAGGRPAGVYRCNTRSPDGTQWCRGGETRAQRLEKMVVDAYFERAGAAYLKRSDDDGAYESLRELWAAASVEYRRDLLRLVIDRIVLPPRAEAERNGRGQYQGRDVLIEWKRDVPLPGHPLSPPPTTLVSRPKTPTRLCDTCGRRKRQDYFRRDDVGNKRSTCTSCLSRVEVAAPRKRNSYASEWKAWREAHLAREARSAPTVPGPSAV